MKGSVSAYISNSHELNRLIVINSVAVRVILDVGIKQISIQI